MSIYTGPLVTAVVHFPFRRGAFDLDGVLIDSHLIVFQAYRHGLKTLLAEKWDVVIPSNESQPIDLSTDEGLDEAARRVVEDNKGVPSLHVFEKLVPTMSTATRETFNQWFSELEATWPEPPREIAGARMLTAQLQPGHWAGVTACSEELARHRLTGAGIAVPAHLVHCDSVDEVGRRIPPKPHPAPFARGYELLGVPIAETLTLGDSPNDHKSALAAAQLAGSELSSVCVGVAVNTAVARALLESGALFTVPDLRQLTVSLGKDGYTAQGRVLSTPQAFEQLSQRPGFGVGGQRAFAERSSDAGLTG